MPPPDSSLSNTSSPSRATARTAVTSSRNEATSFASMLPLKSRTNRCGSRLLSSSPSFAAFFTSLPRDFTFSFSAFFSALSRALMKASSCRWCSNCSIVCLWYSDRFVISSSPLIALDFPPTDLAMTKIAMMAITTVAILAKNKP